MEVAVDKFCGILAEEAYSLGFNGEWGEFGTRKFQFAQKDA